MAKYVTWADFGHRPWGWCGHLHQTREEAERCADGTDRTVAEVGEEGLLWHAYDPAWPILDRYDEQVEMPPNLDAECYVKLLAPLTEEQVERLKRAGVGAYIEDLRGGYIPLRWILEIGQILPEARLQVELWR